MSDYTPVFSRFTGPTEPGKTVIQCERRLSRTGEQITGMTKTAWFLLFTVLWRNMAVFRLRQLEKERNKLHLHWRGANAQNVTDRLKRKHWSVCLV